MRSECENIYKLARKSAELTQEKAAELLNVSLRSLADYEGGKTIPPDDIVCSMAKVYKTDWLGYLHLKTSETGKRYLPDLHLVDLPRSVLYLQKQIHELQSLRDKIVDIACDGSISVEELEQWNKISKNLTSMAGACIGLVISSKKDTAVNGAN